MMICFLIIIFPHRNELKTILIRKVLFDGRMNAKNLLADEQTHRELLNLGEVERGPDGFKKSQSIWKSTIERQGPLMCSSPAIVDGRLYVRTSSAIVCYDLKK